MSARILSKFAKDNENLKLIGGMMENEVLDQAGVMSVANLPTLDEARANIVGILNASASKLISILLARSEKMGSLPPENSESNLKSKTYARLNKIIEDLSSLTAAEAAELSKQLEEKWGNSNGRKLQQQQEVSRREKMILQSCLFLQVIKK